MKLEITGKYKYVKSGLPKETTEHRMIMHSIDPRENESELIVHHIDGDKSNNSPSNLMWLTRSEHLKLHLTGENHFPCDGSNNANYRHGMCVGGYSKEYKKIHNSKSYYSHREERLRKQNEYGESHREEKRLYDKIKYWEKCSAEAIDEDRKAECIFRLNELRRMKDEIT